MIGIKSPAELDVMREAGRLVAQVLEEVRKTTAPGITTLSLDAMAEEMCRAKGALPAFKGYRGFPFSLCCSVNEQVVHGFAKEEPLKEGDILSVDFGVLLDGFYGDAAITVPVGEVSQEAMDLMAATKASLEAGIAKAKPGKFLGDVSHAIQRVVEDAGYSVVRQFVGHGIGKNLHEEPAVPNYGRAKTGPKLKAGMVLAIEPMVNAGGFGVKVLEDGWTTVTTDGKLSAHFEHTVAVTKSGPWILSLP